MQESMQATYSPEDNKLRLYALHRLDAETYARVKAAGFRWAPKQELFVAPAWTPEREDLLIELCDEIDDEDRSPEERAADRAERFGGYRDKRMGEAGASADLFDSGPAVHGYQSQARAERMAARHDRSRVYAVSQWSKAEYWQRRTTGVISHALHKSSAPVRRSRILRIEAEQRKHLATIEQARKRWNFLKRIAAETNPETAYKMAYALANRGGEWGEYQHPRNPERKASLYKLLTDESDPITGAEAATIALARCHPEGPGWSGGYGDRWSRHYELRLTYERAMLEAEGGSAGNVEMEPGGFIGNYQILRVFKSPATGAVVSVMVHTPGAEVWGRRVNYQRINVQRFGADVYRPPTDEDRKVFAAVKSELTEKKRAANAGAPRLINPTREAAQALQDALNNRAAQREKARNNTAPEPSPVIEMTQSQYTQLSKGTYGKFDTYVLHQGPRMQRANTNMYTETSKFPVVCKVRARYGSGWGSPPSVVVLTDKPQAQIPDWSEVAAPAEAAVTV